MQCLKKCSKKNDGISLENFYDKDVKKIKLKNSQDLILKKCLIDELGVSNLRTNGFMHVYNYYKKDNKLIFRIEASGNCDLKTNVVNQGEYIYVKMEGNKKKDKEPAEIKDNIYSNRELGEFSLSIPLMASEYNIKNEQPTITSSKGLFIVTYTIDENKISGEYKPKEEDEV